MLKLKPQNKKFYDYFDRISDILVKSAEKYYVFLSNFENPQIQAKEISRLEQEADKIVQETIELLHKSFITPLDREDIYNLISRLDDVIDLIDEMSNDIILYGVEDILPKAPSFAQVLYDTTKIVQKAVYEIRRIEKNNNIMGLCAGINHLEEKGDDIYCDAVAGLFKKPNLEVLTIIKWKEIYRHIEDAIDKCEDIADLIVGIILKHG